LFELRCAKCGISYPLGSPICSCPQCGGPLDVDKDYSELDPKRALGKRPASLWDFEEVLPPTSRAARVTIGEPQTPIVEKQLSLPGGGEVRILLKNESLMPTGSFKDRGSSVLVSHLRSVGIREAVTDSSGNAAVSMAAYSYVAGISLKVFAPATITKEKRTIIEAFSAKLHLAETREEAAALAKAAGGCYANHSWHPLFFEGTKTLMYEAVSQAGVPDAVVIPLGSGTLFMGVAEALRELGEHSILDRDVKVFLVRPAGYALGEGGPAERAETLAEGIAIRRPHRLEKIRELISKLRAEVVYVDNDDIAAATRDLLKYGIFSEPTGAAAYAALKRILSEKGASEFRRVLVPVTGSGFKALEKVSKLLQHPRAL